MENVYVWERLESQRLVTAAKGCSMGIGEAGWGRQPTPQTGTLP